MKYLFLKYNNYYNRVIKSEFSLDEYVEATPVDSDDRHLYHAPGNNFNFKYNDNINTQLVFNWNKSWTPDYLVLYEGEWANNYIDSRWFIIDSVINRQGQLVMSLKRDIISDDREALEESTLSIERCTLSEESPLIYNSEGMTFNEIKSDEVPIYDRTGCPWIVGYLAKNTPAINRDISTGSEYDINLSTIDYSEWQYYSLVGTVKSDGRMESTTVEVTWNDFWGAGHVGYGMSQSKTSSWLSSGYQQIGTAHINFECSSKDNLNTVKNANRSTYINWTNTENKLKTLYGFTSNSTITDLYYYNGKKILFKDGVYNITFRDGGRETFECKDVNDDVTKEFLSNFSSHMPSGTTTKQANADYTYSYAVHYLLASKLRDPSSIKYSIPTTINSLTDAPYKMFCIPYPRATASSPQVGIDSVAEDKEIALKVAMDIIENTITSGDGQNLYDIQILPFCPIDFTYNSQSSTFYSLSKKTGWVDGVDYTDITTVEQVYEYDEEAGQWVWVDVTVIIGHIFFPTKSSFSFSLDKTLGKSISSYFPLTNKKIQNETEKLRLCASNYSAAFEFNVAKNNGLSSLNISCTYKPYNPFIQVAPGFSGLYGSSYYDNRGLICSGDYSLPIVNSAWTSYQLTNKTYQESFNREISHMEVSNDIARQNAIWSTIAGVGTGAAAGAGGGFSAGGPVGAVTGAAVGGAASTIAGIADYNNLVKQQGEDISYKKDMFNFSLQNIKALPNTIAKTSSIDSNTKYVPFIEKYTCTNEEKKVLEDYLKWNGMTAGYVGSLSLSGFVKANIIRYAGLLEAHEVNEINNELMKGVYLE